MEEVKKITPPAQPNPLPKIANSKMVTKTRAKIIPKNNAEQYMKNQMIGIFQTPPKELVNTTEFKRQQRGEKEKQEKNEALEKQKAKVKAAKIQETKVETVKKYMQYMNQQSAMRKDHPATTQDAWAHELRSEMEIDNLRKGSTRASIRSRQQSSKMSRLTTPGSVAPSEGFPHGRLLSQEISGEYEDGDYELLPKGRIPSWTYFDQFGEDDDGIHVSVGTDSKERAKTPHTPPKMYNVSLGVKPKDIAKVYQTPPWDPWAPKMYDVSVGVGPTDKTMRESEARMRQMLKEKAEMYGEGLLPEEELTEAEIEFRRMERIKLIRKASKRFDAATLARPTGYRDLDLSIPFEGLAFENGIQVNEFEIERTMAAKRGIFLTEGNILWPMNRDFSQELGKRNVEDYVRRGWKLDKEWMFHVRFLQSHNTNYRRKFIYEVQFSMPTITTPVPAATASVFFVFEIGHYAGLEDPIKVHYCLEGTRFCHIPGHLLFNQKWLHGIISDKMRVQRSLDF